MLLESKDITMNFLGVLDEEFRKYVIYSIIEKISENSILMEGVFKVILSKYSILPKYELTIECFNLKEKFQKDPKLYIEYYNEFKNKIAHDLNIPDSKIFIISKNNNLFKFTLVILDRPYLNLKR